MRAAQCCILSVAGPAIELEPYASAALKAAPNNGTIALLYLHIEQQAEVTASPSCMLLLPRSQSRSHRLPHPLTRRSRKAEASAVSARRVLAASTRPPVPESSL